MTATQAQLKRLTTEMSRHGQIGRAAMRAGLDRKTARRYLARGVEVKPEKSMRTWRTRKDPFEAVWSEIEELLRIDAGLDAKTIFEELLRRHPDQFEAGQLRTLQRSIKRWRASSGPEKEVFFAQDHRPGEAMQTDFTWANELEVTIAGQPFRHMLSHSVLPFSNWEWARVCFTESMAALRDGIQEALWRLGKVPQVHQTDNSTAATHDLKTGKRGFNADYLSLLSHYGMTARTIAIGKSEQNGDVEASNGALKRTLDQRLRLRGSRDFETREAYEMWLRGVLVELNRPRATRVALELDAMSELPDAPLPAFVEETVRVTYGSTIRVKHNTYSVPSRLTGERVRVRVYTDRIEAYFADQVVLDVCRIHGEGHHRIDYRHVIDSLVRKPFAFARYRFREDLFPSAVFRRAHEALSRVLPERRADLEYLRLLKLAKETLESSVETAIDSLLTQGQAPLFESVLRSVNNDRPHAPALEIEAVDLQKYDQLLADADRDAALEPPPDDVAKEAHG